LFMVQDDKEFPSGLFDKERVREFLNILADGGELPPDPRQAGLVPESLESFRRRMYKFRDRWEAQYLPRKHWKVPTPFPGLSQDERENLARAQTGVHPGRVRRLVLEGGLRAPEGGGSRALFR
jgi:hypothetical protein